MFWDRAGLKNYAKGAMKQNYGNCVLAAFLISLILGLDAAIVRQLGEYGFDLPGSVEVSVSGISLLLAIFLGNVFLVGSCRFFVENRNYQAPVSKVLFGFQNGNYGNVVWIMFLKDLKISLWTLLLFVPGIIKSYEYRMRPYILAEQPDLPAQDAFAISRDMMMGQKMEAFILDVSFIGWWIASAFTCGLAGIFWTLPYVHAANAELYVVLRDNWMQRQNMGNSYGGQGETF